MEIPDEVVDTIIDMLMENVKINDVASDVVGTIIKQHIKIARETKGFALKEEKRIINEKFVKKIRQRIQKTLER